MENPQNEANSFYPESRAAWRRWLAQNHDKAASIWVILYRKESGVPTLSYAEVVEEALCYGWVDSKPNKRDGQSYYLFLARRKPKSNWSALNKERVARLEAAGLMTEAGRRIIEEAKRNGAWTALDALEQEPEDLLKALAAVPDARPNWDAFPLSARRGILEWTLNAKGAETQARRVEETARLAGQNVRANQYQPKKADFVDGQKGA